MRKNLRPRSNRTAANNITPWYCVECGAARHGQDRVIHVEVYGDETQKRVNSQTKVKARRWFCDNYCLVSWLTRVTTHRVLPPRDH